MNPTDQPTNSQVDGSQPFTLTVASTQTEPQSVERAKLNLDELHENLLFIRQVMAREMKEGQDYGKIPGCGDKPGLFQPGAQKLLMTFKLTPHVKKEVLRDLPHPSIFGHREYEFTISVRSNTGREWDGVGTCSTFESKYRYRKGSRKCPNCGKEAVYKDKKEPGYYCWSKKGGCGTQFKSFGQIQSIESQQTEDTEQPNPAEFWNTVRKMAFKRAIVHASINATNTSELWSQDLEDLPQASRSESVADDYGISNSQAMEAHDDNPCFDTGHAESPQPPQQPTLPLKTPQKPVSGPPDRSSARDVARRLVKALNNLQAAPGQRNRILVTHWAMSKGWINGNQELEAIPAEHVPTNPEQMAEWVEGVDRFEKEAKEVMP